ncbi:nicotinate-nucleotide adenylyltransferase [Shewanella waksmanii]|uniref:nicotinate-nucleotide adenylyltransferase n=1 Tax=Shewanella waksmanii TaxID=213783 RepID=UPI00373698EF
MKIGILGGTFDPIHFGHIRPALAVLAQLNLDKIWLMPNHIPPHKTGTHTTTQQRMEMVELVAQQYPQLALCDIEAQRSTPSYSAETLAQLAKQYPQHTFVFIMGTDSFVNLDKWYQWQSLFDHCHIAVCERQGWQLSADSIMAKELKQRQILAEQLQHQHNGGIIIANVDKQPYSSTWVREKLAKNQSITQAVPADVIDYIKLHHLYQSA